LLLCGSVVINVVPNINQEIKMKSIVSLAVLAILVSPIAMAEGTNKPGHATHDAAPAAAATTEAAAPAAAAETTAAPAKKAKHAKKHK
jgi:hypothetical protein